jgi:cyanophycinase-like exopeptidase
MVIISVDRDELTEITVEGGTSGDQLNVIGRRVVVRVDPDEKKKNRYIYTYRNIEMRFTRAMSSAWLEGTRFDARGS